MKSVALEFVDENSGLTFHLSGSVHIQVVLNKEGLQVKDACIHHFVSFVLHVFTPQKPSASALFIHIHKMWTAYRY